MEVPIHGWCDLECPKSQEYCLEENRPPRIATEGAEQTWHVHTMEADSGMVGSAPWTPSAICNWSSY